MEEKGARRTGNVGAGRVRAIAERASQWVDVRMLRAAPDHMAGGPGAPIFYTTTVAIECVARVGASGDPDTAAAAVLQDVHARLADQQADLLAAGYSLGLSPDLRWDRDDADDRIGVVLAVYTVTHTVSSTDLT